MRRLFATPNDPTIAILRLALGVVFFAHGAQKALGWFGGGGYAATMGMLTHGMGFPVWLADLAIAAEFLGGLGLILGFLTRIAAFGLFVDMLVAMSKVHVRNGFFMNWTGQKHGEGFEFHILALAMLLAVLAHGAGALSVDRAIAGGKRRV
jgi:putative oxidoreductase